jgi:hypothetical protein
VNRFDSGSAGCRWWRNSWGGPKKYNLSFPVFRSTGQPSVNEDKGKF